jgi:hemoglobin
MPNFRSFIFILLTLLLSACTTTPKQSLYDEIGGREPLERAIGLAINRIYNDPQIGHYFKGVPKQHLRKELTDQFCELIDGPCEYTGKTMLESHKDLNIKDSDFFLLVEYVQKAMRDIGFTYEQENRILKHVAPLKSQIVYL